MTVTTRRHLSRTRAVISLLINKHGRITGEARRVHLTKISQLLRTNFTIIIPWQLSHVVVPLISQRWRTIRIRVSCLMGEQTRLKGASTHQPLRHQLRSREGAVAERKMKKKIYRSRECILFTSRKVPPMNPNCSPLAPQVLNLLQVV